MRGWLLYLVAICLSIQAGMCLSPARADHSILFGDAQFGTYDRFNPAILELRATGAHRWTYIVERTGQDIAPALVGALEEISAEFGVLMTYDPAGYRQIASGGLDFIYGNAAHGACGSWATACVADFLSPRQAAIYDSVSMAQWPLRSQTEVGLHEDLHVVGNFAEGYKHDTANPCSGSNRANRSVMGCGLLNAQFIGAYEREAWALSHGPGDGYAAGLGENDGGRYVFWCDLGAKATRVALMAYEWATGAYRWTGVAVPVKLDRNGCQGYGAAADEIHFVDLLRSGELMCLNVENSASTVYGRNDRCLSQ